jgi:hypothetical protein
VTNPVVDLAKQNAHQAAHDESVSLQGAASSLDLQEVLLVVDAAVVGILGELLNPFSSEQLAKHLVAFAFFVALSAGGLVLIWRVIANKKRLRVHVQRSATELHLELERLLDENEQLKQAGTTAETWLYFQHEFERNVRDFEFSSVECVNAVRKEHLNGDLANSQIHANFEQVLESLVQGFANARAELFGYGDDEIYFCDVFEMDHTVALLRRIARACSDEAIQHNRDWPVGGDSDVGDCVYKGKTVHIVYSETEREQSAGSFRESDILNFGCRLATPIPAPDEASREYPVYGVLCLTSSNPERLLKTDSVYLENLAQPLSALFQRRDAALAAIERSSVAQNRRTKSAPDHGATLGKDTPATLESTPDLPMS